MMPEIIFCM